MTKFGHSGDIFDPAIYTVENIRNDYENCLIRLNRESIDLYQIHCPPIESSHFALSKGRRIIKYDRSNFVISFGRSC